MLKNTDSKKENESLTSLPPEAGSYFSQAVKKHRKGDFDAAVHYYSIALELAPDEPSILMNMGVALRDLGKNHAAESCYRRSLAINPEIPGTWTNLGNIFRHFGNLSEAVKCHKKALFLKNDLYEAFYNLGLTLQDMGKLDEAIRIFNYCIKIQPENEKIRWDRALALLAKGDFINGFREYEYRWKLKDITPRFFKQPLWDGASLGGKRIFLYTEQGLGDSIHFVRYASLVANMGGRVFLECQPELVSLFEGVEGIEKIISRNDIRIPDFDVQAPLMSLPWILKHSINDIPQRCPYISVESNDSFTVYSSPGTILKVGIVWAGKSTHKNDHNRSVKVDPFLQLAAIPGVSLYSLQKGPQGRQINEKADGFFVRNMISSTGSFVDTAQIMKQLDLIVSVDTAVVHLAGALNIPVWVLLPYNSDWRWMQNCEDSVWYPSMRLFRQKAANDWESVFKTVYSNLLDFIKNKKVI